METLLKHLNETQRKAVETTEGPVLVLAGAGSGKTRVLTYRVAKIIKDGTKPSNILAVTFTNKAANEIKSRLEKICGDIHLLWAGTFHGICVRMLREYGSEIGLAKRWTIYDDYAQKKCVKEAVVNLKYDPKKYNENKVLNYISKAKEEMVLPENYASVYSHTDCVQIEKIYIEYTRLCRQNNALDFDDLINFGVELLEKSPKAREHYQKKFKYVHVDEFQDINQAQYELITLLSAPQNNIFCVGDDDQSIYGWRGADISIILNFKNDFKDCKIFKLEQNYRSTKNILGAAYEVIKKNNNRTKKKITTENEQGETIEIIEAADGRHEAGLVVESIRDLVDNYGFSYSDIAILYRTNSLSQNFESELRDKRVPYDIYGGFKFYDRKEVKDVIAYLNVINNIYDDINLKRIINTPTRGIGTSTVEKLDFFAQNNNLSLFEAMDMCDKVEGLKTAAKTSIKKFVQIIKELGKEAEIFPPNQLLESIIKRTGYRQMLEEERTTEAEDKLKNIEELINVATNYTQNTDLPTLDDFLQSISLQSDIDNLKEDNGKVLLMTAHSAKGLEFNVVYVVGLEDGIFPHQRSMGNSAEMEEERRLMYVAMTRAKRQLFLSYADARQNNGNWQRSHPSPFIKDIPKNYFTDTEKETDTGESFEDIKNKILTKKVIKQTYSPGNKVKHEAYGRGMVLNCRGEGEGEIVTIIFDDKRYGMKKFYVNKCKLERVS